TNFDVVLDAATTLTINNGSTVHADGNVNATSGGSTTVTDSTVSANLAVSIAALNAASGVTITNSTVTSSLAGVGNLDVSAPGAILIQGGSTLQALDGDFSITGDTSVTITGGSFVGAQSSGGPVGNGSVTSDGPIDINGGSVLVANRNLDVTSNLSTLQIDNSNVLAGATFAFLFSPFTGDLNVDAELAITISGLSFVGSGNGNATVDSNT